MTPQAHHSIRLGIALGCALFGVSAAKAQQGAALRPIPAAECQQLAAQVQQATGIRTTASEDDFTDVSDGVDGRSCHIAGNAGGQSFASPAELMVKAASPFAGYRDEPSRASDGSSASEKGFVNGSRIATVEVHWEPGPGATCSEKEPLSSCNISPQQKMWNVVIDVVEKGR
jgi:hypothetical protein